MSLSNRKNTPETINITLQGNDGVSQDGNENKTDTITYIIELNKKLLQENKELVSNIASIKKELEKKDEKLDEIDDELGLVEKSNGNYKSILKNFTEETKNWKDIYNIQKSISDDNYNHIKEFKLKLNEIRYNILAFYAFINILAMGLFDLYYIAVLIIYSVSTIGVVEYYISHFTLPLHDVKVSKIKAKKHEIKTIEDGLGYIYKFIEDAI